MTQFEFNTKYRDYIVEGYQGLCFDIPECTEYLDKIFDNVIKTNPDFKLKQIKVKFNWYCCYSNLGENINNIITRELNRIHPL